MADDKKKDGGMPVLFLLLMLVAVVAWQVSSHKKNNLEGEESGVVSDSGVRKVGIDENERSRKTFVDLALEKANAKEEKDKVGGLHR